MNIYARKGRARASVQCECTDGGYFTDAGWTRCVNRDHAIAARINAARVPADLLAAMRSGDTGPGSIEWTSERLPLLDAEPKLWAGDLGGVVIIGGLNGGKSHAAAWLLRQAAEMMRARWVMAEQIDSEVKGTFAADAPSSGSAIIAKYVEVPMLVIDELKAASPFTAELLGKVIRGRFERSQGGDMCPTVITANGCPSKVLEPRVWARLAAIAPTFRMDTSGRRGRL